jgi:thiamine transport system permease protein
MNKEKAAQYGWSLVIFLLFYLPIIGMVVRTFSSASAWRSWGEFLQSPLFLRTTGFTFLQAIVSAIGSLLFALPGAYLFGNFTFRGKAALRSLLILPFVLPGILVVLAFIVFYGRNGVVNEWLSGLGIGARFTGLYGWPGIILAHIFYNFPLGIRIIGERWERLDPTFVEAAGVLGARPWQVLRTITLPQLLPSIGYAFLLAFTYAFLSFTSVLVFGGMNFRSFEVLIYVMVNQRLDLPTAQAIALTQIILLSPLIILMQRLGQHLGNHGAIRVLPKLEGGRRPLLTAGFFGYAVLLAVFFGGPLIAILSRSFRPMGAVDGTWSFENYRALGGADFTYLAGSSLQTILGTSLGLALTVGFGCVGLAYFAARSRRNLPLGLLDGLAQLPISISFMTFAFGIYLLAGSLLPPIVLVLWAQIFLGFPLIYAMLRLARREMGEDLLEAAETLGAAPWFRWKSIEWPLMKSALGTGLAFAAALSLGDLSSILILGEGALITLPAAIYRLIGQYRFAYALALGTLFIILAFFLFLLIERLSGQKRKPFISIK